MAEQTNNKGKQIGITALVIVALICVGVIIWWALVQAFAPNKVIYNTYNVGEIQTYDGSDRRNVIEVRYYSNDKGNGVEMLDVKFNEYLDETKTMFYSQGIQFVADTPADSLSDWTFSVDKFKRPIALAKVNWWGTFNNLPHGSIHMYASADNYETTMTDAQALGGEDDFKIELQKSSGEGTDLYLMELQGKNTKKEDALLVSTTGHFGVDIYAYNDVYCVSKKIYEMIQGFANGTTRNVVFDLGDMFEFKNYSNGAYIDDIERDTAKIDVRMSAYYVIKVEVFEDGARQSTDSLFKNIKGSPSFVLDGDYVDGDYYIGRSQVDITNDNLGRGRLGTFPFNGIITHEKDGLLEGLLPYKDNIELSIVIDNDKFLAETGYRFVAFSANSRLEEFKIKEIIIRETIDGVLTEKSVEAKEVFLSYYYQSGG